MADVFTPEKRSQIMSRVKGRGNRATELRLIAIFREHGIRGWRRNQIMFGKPDFVFPDSRLAVFVDGCFWHGCPLHGTIPKSNRVFWRAKLVRNRSRDLVVNRELRKLGWKILRLWQHELRQPSKVARRLEKYIQVARRKSEKKSVRFQSSKLKAIA
jgi:DNA mismatch endonuclease (patch repair protein)